MTPLKWYALLAVADLLALFVFIWFRLIPDTLSLVLAVGLALSCFDLMWPDLGPMFREIFFNE